MAVTLQCPSCGGTQDIRNPGITVVVCGYCSTTLYREGAVLKTGKESVVGEPRSALRVGATGRVGARSVTLVGRIRYAHDRGFWDEWYGEDDRGQTVWLTEDEKTYALETPVQPLATWAKKRFSVGETLFFSGARMQVDEVGETLCEGGEGQLPRWFRPGERYRYVDLTEVNGRRQLTLEIGPDGVEAFAGEDLPPEQIDFGSAEAAAPAPGQAPPELAAHVQCASCGAGFELRPQGDRPETATCHHCDAVLELTPAGSRAVGKNQSRWPFTLEIGDTGDLRGQTWEVVGRMGYRDREGWPTSEYLLWSEAGGYRWLECDGGNYVLAKPTSRGPALAELRHSHPKDVIEIAGTPFRFFERGKSKLVYVDGALPWRARLGDQNDFFDLIAPPKVYSVELSEGELERFIGDHVDAREVCAAFKRSDRYARPHEVGAAAPSPVGRIQQAQAAVVALFALINLGLAGVTTGGGETLTAARLTALTTTQEEAGETEPFEIPEGAHILGLHVDADVSNGWVYLEAELVDEESDAVLGAMGSEVAFYHGVDGGERWSEGSQSGSAYAAAPPPGTYRLALATEADQNVPVTIRLTAGDRLTRYPLILAILLLFYPGFQFARHRSFESARWGEGEDD